MKNLSIFFSLILALPLCAQTVPSPSAAASVIEDVGKLGINATALQGIDFLQQVPIHYGNGSTAQLHFDPSFTQGIKADKEVYRDGALGVIVSPAFIANISKGQVRGVPGMSLPMEVDQFNFSTDILAEYHVSPEFSVYGGPGLVLSYGRLTTSAIPLGIAQMSVEDWTPGAQVTLGVRYKFYKNLMVDIAIQAQQMTTYHFQTIPVDTRFSTEGVSLLTGVSYLF